MNKLPEEQRLAIALVLVEGMSYKEAAEVLEIPIGTLTSRLARGRTALAAHCREAGRYRVNYDDETLMAYADGELDPARRAEIAAAIEAGSGARAARRATSRAARPDAGAFSPACWISRCRNDSPLPRAPAHARDRSRQRAAVSRAQRARAGPALARARMARDGGEPGAGCAALSWRLLAPANRSSSRRARAVWSRAANWPARSISQLASEQSGEERGDDRAHVSRRTTAAIAAASRCVRRAPRVSPAVSVPSGRFR